MIFSLDFEATQFSERIISIGCVAENGNTFYSLVKPAKKKDKVNNFITALTGITNEMLENAPTADEVFNNLFDFVADQGDGVPTYYCYGDCDVRFIERTIKHMTDPRAITFAIAMMNTMIDFSQTAKAFFAVNETIALRKIYALIVGDEVDQAHNALEDAKMLHKVLFNMERCCKRDDKEKFATMKKVERPRPAGCDKNAPALFLSWPNDKWEADTLANNENWGVMCKVGPHVKYFDTLDTAVLWTIRYLTKGVSVKKIADREKVRAKIQEGYENNKMPYSFNWFIKEEEE